MEGWFSDRSGVVFQDLLEVVVGMESQNQFGWQGQNCYGCGVQVDI